MSLNNVCTTKASARHELMESKRKEIFDKLMAILKLEPNNINSTLKKDKLELKYVELTPIINEFKLYYPYNMTNGYSKAKHKEISFIRQVLDYNKHSLKYKFTLIDTGDKKSLPVYYIVTNQ